MQATMPIAPTSSSRPWAGWITGAIAVLFLLFDGGIKVLRLAPAVESTTKLGFAAHLTLVIGLLELACLVVYLLPRTTLLGAVLLTGYLGGAVATQMRANAPVFSIVFPLLIGALLWGALILCDTRLRALLSPRR